MKKYLKLYRVHILNFIFSSLKNKDFYKVFLKNSFIVSKNKRIAKKFEEKKIYYLFLLLSIIGIIFIYSASSFILSFPEMIGLVIKQTLFILIGITIYNISKRVDIKFWYKYINILLVISLFSLIFVLFMPSVNGARRWIPIISGVTIQPSEFFRVFIIIFLAKLFSIYKYYFIKLSDFFKITKSNNFFPLFSLAIIGFLLISMEPDIDITTFLVISLITISVRYYKKFSNRMFLLFIFSFILLAGFIFIASKTVLKEYQLERLSTFINPWNDPEGSGYQIINGNIAFAEGGFFGKGLGGSTQKAGYIPEPYNDFIISVIGEETGLLGIGIIIFIYMYLIKVLWDYHLKTKNEFERLILLGSIYSIGISVIVNIGGVSSVMPMTGLTLPFISYGASSLLSNILLLSICQVIIIRIRRERYLKFKKI